MYMYITIKKTILCLCEIKKKNLKFEYMYDILYTFVKLNS